MLPAEADELSWVQDIPLFLEPDPEAHRVILAQYIPDELYSHQPEKCGKGLGHLRIPGDPGHRLYAFRGCLLAGQTSNPTVHHRRGLLVYPEIFREVLG